MGIIGDRIRTLRVRLDLSKRDFAERYHIPYHSLRAWEAGRFPPNAPFGTLLLLIEREPEVIAEILSRYPEAQQEKLR